MTVTLPHTLTAHTPASAAEVMDNLLALRDAINASDAPGTMKISGGAGVPTGWLPCDGRAVSRTTYADLYAAIGVAWGAGNGSTTFNVPDMQQRFPLGKAASGAASDTGKILGDHGGIVDHSHAVSSHQHTIAGESAHQHGIDPEAPGTSSGGAHTHLYEQDVILHPGGLDYGVMLAGDGGAVNLADRSVTYYALNADLLAGQPQRTNVAKVYLKTTSSDGAHSHSVNSHAHNGLTEPAGVHSHGGVTGLTAPATDNQNPPWAAVNYLIKT